MGGKKKKRRPERLDNPSPENSDQFEREPDVREYSPTEKPKKDYKPKVPKYRRPSIWDKMDDPKSDDDKPKDKRRPKKTTKKKKPKKDKDGKSSPNDKPSDNDSDNSKDRPKRKDKPKD